MSGRRPRVLRRFKYYVGNHCHADIHLEDECCLRLLVRCVAVNQLALGVGPTVAIFQRHLWIPVATYTIRKRLADDVGW